MTGDVGRESAATRSQPRSFIPASGWVFVGEGYVLADCPGCGNRLRLDHEISANGEISPSLDCPLCAFHESGVRLDGWRHGEMRCRS